MLRIKRGDIWLANLDLKYGVEPGKIRPVLVVQHQELLDDNYPSTLIIPLTSQLRDGRPQPLHVRVMAAGELLKDSDLLIDQLRAVDNGRFVKGPLLSLAPETMERVDYAMCAMLGLAYYKPEFITH